ncbi:MAG TPA: ACT domain-containing protein [Candidatus Limnocylindria bacterium]|nr:ACT domain-containing protein [Candidatus Limnocylindria bacterium]
MPHFRLTVERAPGALERVLLVARRRGLGVETLSVTTAADGDWRVSLVAGSSPADAALALHQFRALVNVRHAALEEV